MPDKGLGPKDIEAILHELKAGLAGLYGERLVSVILYGSYARGEAWGGSDIDVAVILSGSVEVGTEIDKTLDVITDLSLKYDTLISVYPVSADVYNWIKSPLLMNLRKEGISL